MLKMHTKKKLEVKYRVPSNLYKDVEHDSPSVVCATSSEADMRPASDEIPQAVSNQPLQNQID